MTLAVSMNTLTSHCHLVSAAPWSPRGSRRVCMFRQPAASGREPRSPPSGRLPASRLTPARPLCLQRPPLTPTPSRMGRTQHPPTQREERDPAGVPGQPPEEHGAQSVDGPEADHHVAHELDPQGAGGVGLRERAEVTCAGLVLPGGLAWEPLRSGGSSESGNPGCAKTPSAV